MSSDAQSPISVFSKTFDTVYPDFSKIDVDDTVLYGVVSAVVVLVILAYIYRDFLLEKIQQYTLQMYLGKPNEIHSAELPGNSKLGSLFNNAGLNDDASDGGSDYDTDADI
jgi:hypothetical protein